ncbi:hypothetical protein MP638_000520 [Amoeboaphelidium occidentale]|nr:hypothetical protein MP638_000520 [Amoeboaphelidium occidentale]
MDCAIYDTKILEVINERIIKSSLRKLQDSSEGEYNVVDKEVEQQDHSHEHETKEYGSLEQIQHEPKQKYSALLDHNSSNSGINDNALVDEVADRSASFIGSLRRLVLTDQTITRCYDIRKMLRSEDDIAKTQLKCLVKSLQYVPTVQDHTEEPCIVFKNVQCIHKTRKGGAWFSRFNVKYFSLKQDHEDEDDYIEVSRRRKQRVRR